jgi:hypothetical protein
MQTLCAARPLVKPLPLLIAFRRSSIPISYLRKTVREREHSVEMLSPEVSGDGTHAR